MTRILDYYRGGRIDSSSDLPRSIHKNRFEHCGFTNSSFVRLLARGVERIESVTCDDVDFKQLLLLLSSSKRRPMEGRSDGRTDPRSTSAVTVTKNLLKANLSPASDLGRTSSIKEFDSPEPEHTVSVTEFSRRSGGLF